MGHSRKTKGKEVDRGDNSDDDGDEMGRLIERLVAKALKKQLDKLKKRAHDSDSEDEHETNDHNASKAAPLASTVSNEAIMAELTWMRAAITRMEARQIVANASTPGASGSRSVSTDSSAARPRPRASVRDAPVAVPPPAAIPPPVVVPPPAVVPLPEKKAMITVTMIREYIGLPEDPKDSTQKDNDRRWYDIRAIIRDLMIKGETNTAYPWKQQDKTKLGTLYGLVRDSVPELQTFANNWGAEFLVQETFNHQRGHRRKSQRAQDAEPADLSPATPPPTVSPDAEHAATPALGEDDFLMVDQNEIVDIDGSEDDELLYDSNSEVVLELEQPPTSVVVPTISSTRPASRRSAPTATAPSSSTLATRSRIAASAIVNEETSALKRKRNEKEEATPQPKKNTGPGTQPTETAKERMKKKGKGKEYP
ncbi:hypothetical protein BDV93DRAFT_558765 [Ceratobasidium sp. AG-I]|nr:hypothetical protein BDV93DRAFT_558765 [Ceratobasidium sp. AG-I]